jgi:hypothetical protein
MKNSKDRKGRYEWMIFAGAFIVFFTLIAKEGPSPAFAEAQASLFGWFTGTTAQSDFSCTFTSAVRFMAFADRS